MVYIPVSVSHINLLLLLVALCLGVLLGAMHSVQIRPMYYISASKFEPDQARRLPLQHVKLTQIAPLFITFNPYLLPLDD
ncbi:uncharacterized protein F5891DRAFT_1090813 [Suillus fuscotomentosus]|uniref:Uncharacterized protein n=1 Tax=Suillus fuscotomentosus TaxID=1912939 RepID=A0AAD4DMV6_9AGAM|nr:uncharacterized protein F5891DRAFT_1090813 [Suillus fuscotomentosus]KAG1884230.1 hypothetical protein F5891DRAFT_1090813 [Suillus fuscotomentosus]